MTRTYIIYDPHRAAYAKSGKHWFRLTEWTPVKSEATRYSESQLEKAVAAGFLVEYAGTLHEGVKREV